MLTYIMRSYFAFLGTEPRAAHIPYRVIAPIASIILKLKNFIYIANLSFDQIKFTVAHAIPLFLTSLLSISRPFAAQ